jgi:hypothetical protein
MYDGMTYDVCMIMHHAALLAEVSQSVWMLGCPVADTSFLI